jgi:cytochrome c556
MRRFLSYVLTLAIVGSAAVMAQKATTPADLDKAMKKVGPAQVAVNKAIQSMAYADAKAQLVIEKQALMDAENFWVVNKKDDAVKISKDVLAKIDVLEKALSVPAPDNAVVMAAYKEVGGTCATCHKTYRVQDENQQFILKPGTI